MIFAADKHNLASSSQTFKANSLESCKYTITDAHEHQINQNDFCSQASKPSSKQL